MRLPRRSLIHMLLVVVGGGVFALSGTGSAVARSVPCTGYPTRPVTTVPPTPPPLPSSPPQADYPPILGAPCAKNCVPLEPTPQGIPAISAGVLQPNGARFTVADVACWVTAQGSAWEAPNAPVPVVTSVQFLSAREVSAKIQDESTGMPDNALLCLVHVAGTFEDWGPLPGPPSVFHDGIFVFNAETGNLLISNTW